ncbi:MAG TPA: Ldh family oxidoreductase [Geminicoccaceae bacterium]
MSLEAPADAPAFDAGQLTTFTAGLFRAAGLDDDKAGTMATILVEGDLLGHTTHGLALAAPYLAALRDGRMTREGEPEVVSEKGGALAWNGRRLPGTWLTARAVDAALAKAREHGIGAVAVRESSHIGCLAAYLERATGAGCMILLTCSDPSEASVAPFGGTRPAFTPDPIAIGIPTEADPILIDISASITTNGLTTRLARAGGRFPGPWVMDADGNATDDPTRVFTDPPGSILPIGGKEYGHKGYGLALTIEALSQGLSGHGRADRPTAWGASTYVQVMDPEAFGGAAAFRAQMSFIADGCRANPPAPGVERVRLPGEAGLARKRRALRDGVRLYPGIMDALRAEAARHAVPVPDPR